MTRRKKKKEPPTEGDNTTTRKQKTSNQRWYFMADSSTQGGRSISWELDVERRDAKLEELNARKRNQEARDAKSARFREILQPMWDKLRAESRSQVFRVALGQSFQELPHHARGRILSALVWDTDKYGTDRGESSDPSESEASSDEEEETPNKRVRLANSRDLQLREQQRDDKSTEVLEPEVQAARQGEPAEPQPGCSKVRPRLWVRRKTVEQRELVDVRQLNNNSNGNQA